jgi:hypothetical protein
MDSINIPAAKTGSQRAFINLLVAIMVSFSFWLH